MNDIKKALTDFFVLATASAANNPESNIPDSPDIIPLGFGMGRFNSELINKNNWVATGLLKEGKTNQLIIFSLNATTAELNPRMSLAASILLRQTDSGTVKTIPTGLALLNLVNTTFGEVISGLKDLKNPGELLKELSPTYELKDSWHTVSLIAAEPDAAIHNETKYNIARGVIECAAMAKAVDILEDRNAETLQ